MPHIPQGTTDTVALELFDPALDAALRPSPDYDVSRWLYVPNTYSEYRYILGTRGQKPLICVGINPSTAAEQRLRQLSHVQCLRPAGHPAGRYGAGVQQRSPRREPESLPLSSLPFGDPCYLGRLGEHHRKAGLPHGLYAGFRR